MPNVFDVNVTFFSVMGYDMSYLEFFGTVFNLLCVWLTVKRKSACWPVGIVGIVLYFALFYQIRLYSDMFEQAYFFVTSIWAWWLWTRKSGPEEKPLEVTRASSREMAAALAATAVGTFALGAAMARIHVWLPSYFPAAADYPYIDAFTTVMSFTATILLARKKFENWHFWIIVDVIGIWLYWVKGVRFIALEYVLFLMMATGGLLAWRRLLIPASYDLRDGARGREVLPAA